MKITTPTVPPIKTQQIGWIPNISLCNGFKYIIRVGGRNWGKKASCEAKMARTVKDFNIQPMIMGETIGTKGEYTYSDSVSLELDLSKTMKDLTTQDIHQMLGEGFYPPFLTTEQRDRIKDLYENGQQWDACRKMKNIISSMPKKALL